MRIRLIAVFVAWFIPAICAELTPNTITILASRSTPIPPDVAVVTVFAWGEPETGVSGVLALLDGTGISAADLLDGQSNVPYRVVRAFDPVDTNLSILWTFRVQVPWSKANELIRTLVKLKSAADSLQGTPRLDFSVSSDGSSAAQAAVCSLPTLISEARKQANAISAAAGMKTGQIVSLSDGSSADGDSVPTLTSGVGAPAPASYWSFSESFLSPAGVASARPLSCVVVVQFRLIQ